MRLIIDRKRWLRGTGEAHSYLQRKSDKKMCCVGFYACMLGYKKKDIIECAILDHLRDPSLVPDWCAKAGYEKSDIRQLYITNDDKVLTDTLRERKIRKLFAKHGVTVMFRG